MRDEILAVLEEKPYGSQALAELLEQPRPVVHKFLLGLERRGDVKRVGARQDWALPSFVTRAGRKFSVDPAVSRDAILKAVASGPLPTAAIAAETGIRPHVLKHLCGQLRDAGALVILGNHRGSRWALPTYQAPAAPTPEPRAPSPETRAAAPKPERPAVKTVAQRLCRRCEQRPVMPHSRHGLCAECRGEEFRPAKPQRFSREELKGLDVDALLAIRETAGVTLVCPGPGCGRRFSPDRVFSTERGDFCSLSCANADRPVTRTRVVNGIEYEATSIGAHSISSWRDAEEAPKKLTSNQVYKW